MIIQQQALNNFEQRYRATFINSLAGFKTAVLVGTKSSETQTNLAIFNSLTHIGANPPLYGLVFRPNTVERHTLNNILSTKKYTLNYMSASHFEKAHQTSAKYKSTQSEFEAVGFQEQYIANFEAPFIKEAVVKIAMSFEEQIDIKINGTILIIGSIQHIELEENLIANDGFVALHQANVLSCVGLDAYYSSNFLGRLSYTKPDTWPSKIIS